MKKKGILRSNKDYDSYSVNKYDRSFSNQKSGLKSRKMSISSMNEQLSKLNSDIEELYKIYKETKEIRLRKEKSEKNIANRVRYLTLEEKKLRSELTNKNKNYLKKYYLTNYNANKNFSNKNKRTKSMENLNIINLKQDFNSLIIQERKHQLKYNSRKIIIKNQAKKNIMVD